MGDALPVKIPVQFIADPVVLATVPVAWFPVAADPVPPVVIIPVP